MSSKATVQWIEIPVRDLNKGAEFYRSVFGFDLHLREGGPNPYMDLSDAMDIVSGHLYPGKPATPGEGPTIHLTVPGTLEECIAACEAAGGTIVSPAITIPPGRFVYATDPDGNSIGLFEPAA